MSLSADSIFSEKLTADWDFFFDWAAAIAVSTTFKQPSPFKAVVSIIGQFNFLTARQH